MFLLILVCNFKNKHQNIKTFVVRYLPVTERKQDEQNHEFVTRVQQNMARSLGLTASELTYHDVIEHIKSFSVKGEGINYYFYLRIEIIEAS